MTVRRFLVLAAAVLAAGALGVGQAAAANPITVALTATGQPSAGSTQTCVSIVTTDSVSNQPVAADLVLQVGTLTFNAISHALMSGGTVAAKTDFTGKGSICFDPPPLTLLAGANVTLYQGTAVVVHGSPDYTTTGTSNTVSVKWSSSTPPAVAVTPSSSSPSLVSGVPDTVNVAISYNGGLTAVAPTIEVDLSGVAASVSSATASSGSCAGTTTVTCSLSDLPKGSSTNVTLQLLPSASGQLALAFDLRWHTTVTSQAGQVINSPGDQTASLALTVAQPSANVSVALPKASRVAMGKTASVTAVVRNLGPQPALGTKVAFTLPGNVKLVRYSGTGLTCSRTTRICTIASITPSSPARIVLTLLATKAGTRQLSAKATVVGATDPTLANNVGKLALTVLPKPRAKH
ncbi:MAG TPA: hypothetical protein VH063_14215 [Gaiellaceae bacterium]|nr:hypothetical protein [Gaiellaceae bacterium]